MTNLTEEAGPNTEISVALIVVDQTAPAILYCLKEVFAFTAAAWEEMTGQSAGPIRINPVFVADSLEIKTCALGAPIKPDASFSDDRIYDIVIATDTILPAGFNPSGQWPEASVWLAKQYKQGALLTSVCSGSILLAEAGILDNVEATTHWSCTACFDQYYPKVDLSPQKILVLSGEEQRIITAGGASSWEELSLYLIARFCGAEEAARTAKVFLLGDRSQGQLPFASMARSRSHEDQVIDRCQAWIANHYEQDNPVTKMVKFSGINERTFKRRFKAATGYSPIEYVQTLRVEEAKQLLETTSLASDDIAREVGYEDPASFRRLFKRSTGVTPAKYRQRFKYAGQLAY